jgi:alpha-L-arabinofuranosidase
MNQKPVSGAEGQSGLFASAVQEQKDHTIIVKVVNTSDKVQSVSLNFSGLKKNESLSDGHAILLHSTDLDKDNTLEQPSAIVPQESVATINGNVFSAELEPYTLAIYTFKLNNKHK